MKVILLEDVKSLGKAGSQVEVADGYARNSLIPKAQALVASPANQRVFDNEKKALAKKSAKEKAASVELAAKLEALTLTITRLAGDSIDVYASATVCG